MRVAICISGQPRDIEVGVEQVITNIINCNAGLDFDVFAHAWVCSSGEPWDTAQNYQRSVVGKQEGNPYKKILNYLKPKLWLFEEQIRFENYTKFFNTHPTAKQSSLASNFYSVYAANNMKKQYENMKGFVYNYVVRMRYDLFFNKPVTLLDYEDWVQTGIVVPKNYQEDQDRIAWNIKNKGMVDVFAISSSENMDKYSETFLQMPSVNREYSPPFGEVYLGVNTRIINDLNLHYADIDLDLIRRTNQK
tara:strand:- start:236 stop:982 length:747 start_codon:yes stop_codon:yes gene_type:complete